MAFLAGSSSARALCAMRAMTPQASDFAERQRVRGGEVQAISQARFAFRGGELGGTLGGLQTNPRDGV